MPQWVSLSAAAVTSSVLIQASHHCVFIKTACIYTSYPWWCKLLDSKPVFQLCLHHRQTEMDRDLAVTLSGRFIWYFDSMGKNTSCMLLERYYMKTERIKNCLFSFPDVCAEWQSSESSLLTDEDHEMWLKACKFTFEMGILVTHSVEKSGRAQLSMAEQNKYICK